MPVEGFISEHVYDIIILCKQCVLLEMCKMWKRGKFAPVAYFYLLFILYLSRKIPILFGQRREKPCLPGFRSGRTKTIMLSYKDYLE